MPPKGWRKYQDGFKAAPGAPSNVEDEKFIIDVRRCPRTFYERKHYSHR